MTIKHCKNCFNLGYFQDGIPGCSLNKQKVDIEKDYCTWHKMRSAVEKCQVCQKDFATSNLHIWYTADESKYYAVCENCLEYMGTCSTCQYQNDCAFSRDHSEPQIVMKQVQKGFMTMQTQVKNPNLVMKHCSVCRCSTADGDHECQKDEHGISCNHWQSRL